MPERTAARDWQAEIEELNASASGERRIEMGSSGSAQVTRVRLLDRWDNLEAWTEGPVLYLRRSADRCIPRGKIPRTDRVLAPQSGETRPAPTDLDPPLITGAPRSDLPSTTPAATRDAATLRGLRDCAALLRAMVASNTIPLGYAERVMDALHLVEYGIPRARGASRDRRRPYQHSWEF